MDSKKLKRIKIYLIVGAVLLVVLLAVPRLIFDVVLKPDINKEHTTVQTSPNPAGSKEELDGITESVFCAIGYDGDIEYLRDDGQRTGTVVNRGDFNFRIYFSECIDPIMEDGKPVYRDYVEENMWADFDIIYSQDHKFALVNFGGDEEVTNAFLAY